MNASTQHALLHKVKHLKTSSVKTVISGQNFYNYSQLHFKFNSTNRVLLINFFFSFSK